MGAHSKGILQWSEQSHYHTHSVGYSQVTGKYTASAQQRRIKLSFHVDISSSESKLSFHPQLHRLALVCSSFRRLNKDAGYCGKQDVVKVFSSLLSQVLRREESFFLAMLLCHSLLKGNAHSLLKGNALHVETWSPLTDMIKMACTLLYDNCFSLN